MIAGELEFQFEFEGYPEVDVSKAKLATFFTRLTNFETQISPMCVNMRLVGQPNEIIEKTLQLVCSQNCFQSTLKCV
jgi:hypothetical protein